MNLLAHAILSPANPGVRVGNVVADFVKGRVRKTLPGDVQAGIELHRRIDAFTDLHPIVLGCATMLEERWGRYATVLVDIFFDHCLTAAWGSYADGRREDFVVQVYGDLRAYRACLPERAQLAVTVMMGDDWLNAYAQLDGLRLALTRLSRRLRHGIELAPAVDDFAARQVEFDAAFAAFFPQLVDHVGAARQ